MSKNPETIPSQASFLIGIFCGAFVSAFMIVNFNTPPTKQESTKRDWSDYQNTNSIFPWWIL